MIVVAASFVFMAKAHAWVIVFYIQDGGDADAPLWPNRD